MLFKRYHWRGNRALTEQTNIGMASAPAASPSPASSACGVFTVVPFLFLLLLLVYLTTLRVPTLLHGMER